MVHELKILPYYFNLVESGMKTFEIRLNDRNYQVGDILILHEYYGGKYTDKKIVAKVDAVINFCVGVKKGYIVLLIETYKKIEI